MTFSTEDIFNKLVRQIRDIRDGDHQAECGDGGDCDALGKLRGLLESALSEIGDEIRDISRSY